MAINYLCKNCKTAFSLNHKKCPNCGEPVPRVGKTYRVRVQVNGKRITRTVPNNLELAKEIEAKIKAELISGEYYDRREQAKLETTFNDFFESKYLPYAKQNKKSYNREETLYRLWIKPVIGNKQLNKISPFDIEKLKKQMAEADKAPRTIQYALAVIRHIINKAKDWGYFLGDNPIRKVKMPTINNRRIRFLTREEANTLLNELKKRSKQTYEMAYLSLYTGMRFGEIASLIWQDIDFENDKINIKDPKNATSRVAYLTEKPKKLLLEKKEREKPQSSSELVFKDAKGKKINKISHSFHRVVKALGLNDGVTDPRDKVVFHTLRHTFASWLAIQGTPIYTIKELMGHKTLAMTERYSHLAPNTKQEAVKKVFGNISSNGEIIEADFKKEAK